MGAKKRAKARPKTKSKRRASRQVIEARTAGLSFLNKSAFVVLLVLVCVAVAMLLVPQWKELQRLEGELDESHRREQEVLDQTDQRKRELTALRGNPEFQELQARDLLELSRPGETVIRIERN